MTPANKRCVQYRLREALQTQFGLDGSAWETATFDEAVVEYFQVREEFPTSVQSNYPNLQEVRIRMANVGDTLSGTEPENVVNRLTLPGLAYHFPNMPPLWLRRPGSLQYEQSPSARELFWEPIAEATFDVLEVFANNDRASGCGLH